MIRNLGHLSYVLLLFQVLNLNSVVFFFDFIVIWISGLATIINYMAVFHYFLHYSYISAFFLISIGIYCIFCPRYFTSSVDGIMLTGKFVYELTHIKQVLHSPFFTWRISIP